MSDNLLAWFPLHALQWVGRLAHLTSAERGALVSVVLDSWNASLRGAEPGTFPDDPLAFERVIGKTWRRELRGVRQHFVPDPETPNQLRCAWVVEMHREQLSRHNTFKANGQKGGRPRKSLEGEPCDPEKPGFSGEKAGLNPGLSPAEAGPKHKEVEVEVKRPAAAGARVRVREEPRRSDEPPDVLALFDHPHRAIVARFLDEAPDGQRVSLAALLGGWLRGQGYAGGRAARQEDIATGLADYLSQPDARRTFTPKGFRAFVEDAERRRTSGGSGAVGRQRTPEHAERSTRATELHTIVIREHLGSLNGIQFEQHIAALREAGTLDDTTVADIRTLAPLSDFARARSEDEGRRLAIERFARAARPQLSVVT